MTGWCRLVPVIVLCGVVIIPVEADALWSTIKFTSVNLRVAVSE